MSAGWEPWGLYRTKRVAGLPGKDDALDAENRVEPAVGRGAAVRRTLIAVAGLVFALGIAATAPFQRGSLLVVSAAAVVVLFVGLRRPVGGSTAPITIRAALPWIVLFLCWCAWEVAMYYAGNSPEWPTMSILSDRVFDQPAGRFCGGLAWYWGAVWLVRATGPPR